MGRTVSQELNELRRRVAAWRRQGGGRGSRIPDALWNDAARVARVDGIWLTAQALHFNYARLRGRVEQGDGSERAEGTRAAELLGVEKSERNRVEQANDGKRAEGNGGSTFVELTMEQLSGGGKTMIELQGRHGDRMRIEMTSGVDLLGLVRTFCCRGEP